MVWTAEHGVGNEHTEIHTKIVFMSAKDAKYKVWHLNPGRGGQGEEQDNV